MDQFINSIKEELLKKYKPDLIIITGSYAHGTQAKYSDLDFQIFFKEKIPKTSFIIEPRKINGKPVLISIAFSNLKEYIKSLQDPDFWIVSYGILKAKVLHDDNLLFNKIKKAIAISRPSQKNILKKSELQIGLLLEYLGKLKNACADRDELNIYSSSRRLSMKAFQLLRILNPIKPFYSSKEIYPSLLKIKNKPKHYVEDFKLCYGLTKSRNLKRMCFAAKRLAKETVLYLRKNKSKIKNKKLVKYLERPELIHLINY